MTRNEKYFVLLLHCKRIVVYRRIVRDVFERESTKRRDSNVLILDSSPKENSVFDVIMLSLYA
jgi:hypothetical protein